jgi:PrtD family type I secretion system ABC transporter
MEDKERSVLQQELRRHMPALWALFLLSFLSPIFWLTPVLYMYQISERILLSKSETSLWFLFAIAMYIMVLWAIIDNIRSSVLRRVGISFDERISRLVFTAVHQDRPNASVGHSVVHLNDVNSLRDAISSRFIAHVFDAFWAPVILIVLFFLHPLFCYAAAALLVVFTAFSVANLFIVRKDASKMQRAAVKEVEFATAVARSAETVRALGMLPRLQSRWYQFHRAMLGWQSRSVAKGGVLLAITQFIQHSQFILFLTLGSLLYFNQEVTLGAIFAATILVRRGLGPIEHVINSWRVIPNAWGSYKRLDKVLAGEERSKQMVALPRPSGALNVSRVSATAPGRERTLINDVSFVVPAGHVLGIVGPSGAGKSCLARLLVGIWKPNRGTIGLDDHDLSHWDPDELGAHLGYMSQDIELLPGTIAENIARFQPNLEEASEAILEAATLAGIQDIVRTLPDGFNTRVGPNGYVLSSGQRQRIALARALFDNPRLVVLDEPNSNLDATGEEALLSAIWTLKSRGVTIVVVTHKVNLLSCCDEVLVLNGGSVQAHGAREQIVNRIPRLKAAPMTVIEGARENRAS